jgi:CRISPR-associated endoribonuclease Cas6/Csy4 subtype I-F
LVPLPNKGTVMHFAHYLDCAIHSDLRDGYGLSAVLAAVHTVNRSTAKQGDSYPLGVAFPFWIDPSFHATKMMGFGSAGPIVRVFAQTHEQLHNLNSDSRILELQSIGEVSVSQVGKVPNDCTSWFSFVRASDGEALTPSHQRRLIRRAAARGSDNDGRQKKSENAAKPAIGYLKLPLASASAGQSFLRPVRRIESVDVKIVSPRFDSWGFSKSDCWLPKF